MYSGLNKSLSELLNAGRSIVLWRMPGENTTRLISCEKPVEVTVSGSLPTGFLFAPFNTSKSASWLFEGEAQDVAGEENFIVPESHLLQTESISASREEYMALVQEAVGKMQAGEYQKIVAARAFPQKRKQENVGHFFKKMCENYPKAFCYLVSSPQTGTWLGATPELLLDYTETTVKTMALAGTKTTEPETWKSKELQEQQYVSDYILATLQARGLEVNIGKKEVLQAGHLFHLVNEIEGKGENLPGSIAGIISELHPTPAVAGLPKEKAMDFITRNEGFDRKYYSGFLGYNEAKQGRFFVNLRCMEWKKDHCLLYAGAGLTKDSDAEKEWEETNSKLQVLGRLF